MRPGIEVRSSGDLRIAADWSLPAATAEVRATAPHAGDASLTLRAGGDLHVSYAVTSGFDRAGEFEPLPVAVSDRGGSLRAIAGADLASANPLATLEPVGRRLHRPSRLVFFRRATGGHAANDDGSDRYSRRSRHPPRQPGGDGRHHRFDRADGTRPVCHRDRSRRRRQRADQPVSRRRWQRLRHRRARRGRATLPAPTART